MVEVLDTVGLRLRYSLDVVTNVTGDNLAQISKKSGIPYRSLQDYLSDKRVPGGEALKKFQNIGLDINWILGEDGEMEHEDAYFGYKFAVRSAKEKLDDTIFDEIDRYYYALNKKKSFKDRIKLTQLVHMKEMFDQMIWNDMNQRGLVAKYFSAYVENDKEKMSSLLENHSGEVSRIIRSSFKIMVGEEELTRAEESM